MRPCVLTHVAEAVERASNVNAKLDELIAVTLQRVPYQRELQDGALWWRWQPTPESAIKHPLSIRALTHHRNMGLRRQTRAE